MEPNAAARLPRPEFAGHALEDSDLERIDRIRVAFSDLLDAVDRDVPPGRERALVLTKLQEASMWAIRGIAVAPKKAT